MATSKNDFHCRKCNRSIQGNSELCVRCWNELHKPCSACMIRSCTDNWTPRRRGKPLRPVDCPVCNNERWVILDYTPHPEIVKREQLSALLTEALEKEYKP